MPSLAECIALYEAGRPIRVIRALVMTADGWTALAGHTGTDREERRGYCELATLGRRFGVPVGRVLEP